MKLRTIKAENELGMQLALNDLMSKGWNVARNCYQKIIDGQRYYYIDMYKDEINEELKNERTTRQN